MEYYVLSGQMQEYLTSVYEMTGESLDFRQAICHLHGSGKSRQLIASGRVAGEKTELQFDEMLSKISIPVFPTLSEKPKGMVREFNFFPDGRDVVVYKQFAHIRGGCFRHECFEMAYVYKGSCMQCFEGETRVLREGEFCIVAPGSSHDFTVEEEDSVVFRFMLRNKTFETAFFDLMRDENLLSAFFKTMLYGDSYPNYLLFYIENPGEVNDIVQRLLTEQYTQDGYSNSCSLHYIQLLFASLLRGYEHSSQYRYYGKSTHYNVEIPAILQYIQENFRQLTLAGLASHFHYSESHLSRLIRKSTGQTFTEILTGLKRDAALEYLVNSDYSVARIADLVGYESADHLSRTFKKWFGCPPQQYRKEHSRVVA